MGWSSIDDVVRTSDSFAQISDALATVLGEWARTIDEPSLAPMLAGHAAAHAWHAELWRRRRPAVAEGEPTAMSAADDDVDHVLELAGTEARRERLAAFYEQVLPRLIERAEHRRSSTDPLIDAPTARVLDLVLTDLRAHCVAAASLGLRGGTAP